MSGKILIVDELATNRIVLKVKLSAAYYEVIQAGTGADAVTMAARERPDLILANGALSDMECETFLEALEAAQGTDAAPVVMILPDNTTEMRLRALTAGASDVIGKPVQEPLLLARLRSLLRQRHSDDDLKVHADTAAALGLNEDAAEFRRPGRIAILGHDRPRALRLRDRLAGLCRHEVTAFDFDRGPLAEARAAPDIVLLCIDEADRDDGLRLLADLRAAPQTRQSRFMVMLDEPAAGLAATLLDMGADDVIPREVDQQELLLRLSMQLKRKKNGDRMRDRLQNGLQAAVIDPLTGLFNRRYAYSYLNRILANGSGRDGASFAVMVGDLDHFKRINDCHGHAAGDNVLTHVANRLQSGVRGEDLVARIGGEEFLIVIADTSRGEARQTAGRLCSLIRDTPVPLGLGPGPAPVPVTISIGVTLGRTGPDAPRFSAEDLINQADRALYGAKAGGRNTVTFCTRTAA